jgi:hypothetical protein
LVIFDYFDPLISLGTEPGRHVWVMGEPPTACGKILPQAGSHRESDRLIVEGKRVPYSSG